jgi:chemotaxis protein methyltransferase CheR
MTAEPLATPSDTAGSFRDLKQFLINVTGLAYYADKDIELKQLIRQRMTALKIDRFSDYLSRLQDDAWTAELDTLTTSLTIGETYFFRHEEMFDALRMRAIPDLIASNQQRRRLHIWSAGCAIGAEPYSMAILLRRHFAVQLADWDVRILATDINRESLKQAEGGQYCEWSLRTLSKEMREACFTREGSKWSLGHEFRQPVTFRPHNLVQPSNPVLATDRDEFDLILCRNVMIYFESSIVHQLVARFYDALAIGGWLVVGPSEPSVEVFRQFEPVNLPGAVLYRKPAQHFGNATQPVKEPLSTCVQVKSTSVQDQRNCIRRPAGQRQLTVNGMTCANPSGSVRSGFELDDVRGWLNRGQPSMAADVCRRHLENHPLDPRAHLWLAFTCEQEGDYGQAEQQYRRAIYLDRTSALAHYYLAMLQQRMLRKSAAQRSFENVIALLRPMCADAVIDDVDGLTVSALAELAAMNLEALEIQ